MLRSFLDHAIADALEVCARFGAALPPFATWSPEEAVRHPAALDAMIAGGLGWNVVEFGSGVLRALTANDVVLAAGQRVRVGIAPQAVRVLPPD